MRGTKPWIVSSDLSCISAQVEHSTALTRRNANIWKEVYELLWILLRRQEILGKRGYFIRLL